MTAFEVGASLGTRRSVAGCRLRVAATCLEAGVEGNQGRPALQGAEGTVVVAVGAEGVELQLEVSNGLRGRLFGEVALQGLVEALDLAAGLRVGRRGVLGGDGEALQFALEQDLALARGAGEDGAVVGRQGPRGSRTQWRRRGRSPRRRRPWSWERRRRRAAGVTGRRGICGPPRRCCQRGAGEWCRSATPRSEGPPSEADGRRRSAGASAAE